MSWRLILIFSEIMLITYLDYRVGGLYYSFGVLYCLPVIQTAHISAIRALRRSDSRAPLVIGVLSAVAWSAAEAAVIWPQFPISALALNIFTRATTFTVLGRVVMKLFKEREYSRKDALTGLANRLEFFDRFEIEQSRSERSGEPYSVLFVDIDHFKILNDTLGHHIGDEALKALSKVFTENSRKLDTVSRIGGDEFALLFPSTDENTCQALIDRISLASEKKFRSQDWPITLSIGHVTETGKNKSAEEVLREADEKMYSVKKAKHLH
jgi:diguanylate cyclase (GGDEF)-like protein